MLLQFTPSACYPDSLHSVRPQIRSPHWSEGKVYKSNPPYKFLNGSYIQTSMDSNSLKRDRFAFYMPDGGGYWFIIAGGAGVIIPQSIVYIDINGGKSPNIIGKDVFLFHRVPGKGILPSGYQQPANTVSNVCQRDGQYCAAKIMQDGWKITYPY